MSRKRMFPSVMAAVTVFAAFGCSAALAAGPEWRLDSAADTTAAPGGTLDYLVQTTNMGEASTDGSDVELLATLPSGLTAVEAVEAPGGEFVCTAGDGVSPVLGASSVKCVLHGAVLSSFNSRGMILSAAVDPAAHGVLTAAFSVTGGGAHQATTVDPTTITSVAPEFGIDAFGEQVLDNVSRPFTQAGGHPYSVTTEIDLNTLSDPRHFGLAGDALWPVEPAKDMLVELPAGFVGDPTLGKCTTSQLATGQQVVATPLCPPDSQVGVAFVRANTGSSNVNTVGPVAIYNMVPPPNMPARFGLNVLGTVVTLDASVRSGSDYGLTVGGLDTSEGLDLAGVQLTFWGVPADPVHDHERACPGGRSLFEGGATCPSGARPAAFLRNPTSCTLPGVGLTSTLRADSWTHPGRFGPDGPDLSDPAWHSATFVSHLPPNYPAAPFEQGPPQGPTGCELVPFHPSVEVQPSSHAADSPTGLAVSLTMPQQGLTDPSAIAESDLRSVTMTFPQGMRVSPSAAQGLGSCTPAQIQLHSRVPVACPDSSKLGSVTIETPLLEKPLTGAVYLATPHENPFGSLVSLYLVASGQGVVVKLPGEVRLDPSTGQLTASFQSNPQLPFTSVKLAFDAGPRAALVTPAACGTYSTHAALTSWSGKTVELDAPFTLSEGAGGTPCVAAGFAPSLLAGVQNAVAGVFSPFSLRLARGDGEQELGTLSSLHLPPGLLANVASVPVRCSEAQAAAAQCPAGSHVGTVTVGAGAGPSPFFVHGDVYLMGQFHEGPFAGDPFGLAIVTHAVAGPFDLGTVVVQAGVQIHDDGSITTQSEPFPSILEGIPLDLRDVRVDLDRTAFMLNPTSCEPSAIGGQLSSLEGALAPLSSRFQVGDCASLSFNPKFEVSTQGNGTFKHNGASLDVKIATGQGPKPAGTPAEANIRKVEVQLPLALPSRLETLQRACTEKQFATDPHGCPPESAIGRALAHSPILASALEGTAYLVSHGGAAFPDLVLVLTGEGITLDVTGHTQIKGGTTYSKFETVPDAPISSFELTLPEGPFSVLAASEPLCGRIVTLHKHVLRKVHGRRRRVLVTVRKRVPAKLLMPTKITAQNGAVHTQTTHIAVAGCPTAHGARHHRR